MTAPSVDGFFGGGGKSLKFENIGDSVTGTIDTIHDPEQQKKPDGDLVWADKEKTRPKWQMRVVLQTSLREDDDDTGLRTLYIKGHLHFATSQALQSAKAKALGLGGTLQVTHTGTKPSTTPGYSAIKEFAVVYTPPNTQAAGFFNNGGGQEAPQPPVDQAAAAQAAIKAAQDQAAAVAAAQAAATAAATAPAVDVAPAPFTQDVWDGMPAETKKAIRDMNGS